MHQHALFHHYGIHTITASWLYHWREENDTTTYHHRTATAQITVQSWRTTMCIKLVPRPNHHLTLNPWKNLDWIHHAHSTSKTFSFSPRTHSHHSDPFKSSCSSHHRAITLPGLCAERVESHATPICRSQGSCLRVGELCNLSIHTPLVLLQR